MYDFHFGSKREILAQPRDFLIFVKRLLPRWINGIPDSECLAIYDSLDDSSIAADSHNCLVETGCGASTLAMFLWACQNNIKVFSWDTNGSKGSFLKSVISEAIAGPLEVDLYNHWSFVPFDSTSQHAGIPIIGELGLQAAFGFFDSWHTRDHVMKEIKVFESVSASTFLIALDDAYYKNKSENYAFTNVIRTKLGLEPIAESPGNICSTYYEHVEDYLRNRYPKVLKLDDTYKTSYSNDIFFDYFSRDRQTMNKFGMENSSELAHRFDIWKVTK